MYKSKTCMLYLRDRENIGMDSLSDKGATPIRDAPGWFFLNAVRCAH